MYVYVCAICQHTEYISMASSTCASVYVRILSHSRCVCIAVLPVANIALVRQQLLQMRDTERVLVKGVLTESTRVLCFKGKRECIKGKISR